MQRTLHARLAATSLRKALAAAALLCAGAAHAAPVTVDFTVTRIADGVVWGTGSFTGVDTDNDGVLSLAELTSFDGSQNVAGATVGLADLTGFGDFDLLTSTWESNAIAAEARIAYFTWNDPFDSVDRMWATVSTNVVTAGATVPEPGSLTLGASALLALAAARRRKGG